MRIPAAALIAPDPMKAPYRSRFDPEAGEPCRFAALANEEEVPAGGRVFVEIPERDREAEAEVDRHRQSENLVLHESAQRIGHCVEDLTARNRKRDARQDGRGAERSDEGIDADPDDEEAVDHAGQDADQHGRDDNQNEREVERAGEVRGQNGAAAKHRADRKIEFAGGQRQRQAEREDHQDGLGTDDGAEIAEGEECVGQQEREDDDEDDEREDDRVAVGDHPHPSGPQGRRVGTFARGCLCRFAPSLILRRLAHAASSGLTAPGRPRCATTSSEVTTSANWRSMSKRPIACEIGRRSNTASAGTMVR